MSAMSDFRPLSALLADRSLDVRVWAGELIEVFRKGGVFTGVLDP